MPLVPKNHLPVAELERLAKWYAGIAADWRARAARLGAGPRRQSLEQLAAYTKAQQAADTARRYALRAEARKGERP